MTVDKKPRSQERREQFASLLADLEERARTRGQYFSRQRMAGAKRDLVLVLRRALPAYRDLSESAIEEDMRAVGCKFPPAVSRSGVDLKTFFPELFQ